MKRWTAGFLITVFMDLRPVLIYDKTCCLLTRQCSSLEKGTLLLSTEADLS